MCACVSSLFGVLKIKIKNKAKQVFLNKTNFSQRQYCFFGVTQKRTTVDTSNVH